MRKEQWQEKVGEIIRDPAGHGFRECSLCGRGVISIVGVLIPRGKLAKALKQPAGKHRTVIYALCEECTHKDMATDLVEEEIFKQLQKDGQLPMMEE